MTRFWFTLIILIVKLCLIHNAQSKSSADQKPNILIIIADDLGYGDVGILGNDTIRTPNIDRIGLEGIVLTQHLAAAPVCTPSRAAFLTGKYPIRIGMAPTNDMRVIPWISCTSGLPTNETTLAQIAQKSGYMTALIGKWHLGLHCSTSDDFCHHPLKQGFDYFYGGIMTTLKDFGDKGESVIISQFLYFDSIILAALLGFITSCFFLRCVGFIGRKFLWFLLVVGISLIGLVYWLPHGGIKFANSILHRNFEVVEQPIRFEKLTQRLVWEAEDIMTKSKNSDKPFFLIVNWFQVHTFLYNSVPGFHGNSKHGSYGDNVEEMDWSVGQLLAALDRLGVSSDTLVYFSSDNGGHIEETNHLGERAGGHNGPWSGGKLMAGVDGGVRVPTVMRWPKRIPGGSLSDEATNQMDVFPTFANVMGYQEKLPSDLDGYDILPLLSAPTSGVSPHSFMFHYCGHVIQAARWNHKKEVPYPTLWKLRLATPDWREGTEGCAFTCGCYDTGTTGRPFGVFYHDPPLIFNKTADPQEMHPLTPGALYNRVLTAFQTAIDHHKASIKPVPNQFAWHKVLWRPWLQPCCNFPSCNCRDTKWDDHKNI